MQRQGYSPGCGSRPVIPAQPAHCPPGHQVRQRSSHQVRPPCLLSAGLGCAVLPACSLVPPPPPPDFKLAPWAAPFRWHLVLAEGHVNAP